MTLRDPVVCVSLDVVPSQWYDCVQSIWLVFAYHSHAMKMKLSTIMVHPMIVPVSQYGLAC